MFYLISKDPMTQYLLRIEKSFCNDNFRINFLLLFSHSRPHNDRAIVIVLMGSLNSRMGVSSLTIIASRQIFPFVHWPSRPHMWLCVVRDYFSRQGGHFFGGRCFLTLTFSLQRPGRGRPTG
jgi:hypothetical protein